MNSLQLVQWMLTTCTECYGRGQLKMHSYEPHMINVLDAELTSAPLDIGIIITMCSSCYNTGKVIDKNKWWIFLQNEQNTHTTQHVQYLLDKYFKTGINEIDDNQYLHEV